MAWADGRFPVYIAFEKLGLNLYVNNSSVFTSLFYLKLSLLVHIVLKFSSLSLTFILCQFWGFFLSCMFMLFATVFFSLGWRPSAVWRRQNNHYSVLLLYISRISFRCQDSDCLKAAGALFQCILYIFRNQINADNYLVY